MTDAGLKSGVCPMQPYPAHLVTTINLGDGTPVTIRPIRAADAGIEQDFVRGLSSESRYYRFMDMLRELPPSMLKQFTAIDYDNQMALIASATLNGKETEIAVARYIVFPDGKNCEFAIVVADAWQGKGVATALMRQLIKAAQSRGLKKMTGEVLTGNSKMLHFATRLGFHAEMDVKDPTLMHVTQDLNGIR